MMRTRKNRYKLASNGIVLGESPTIDGIAELVGCTKQHLYQRLVGGKFTYKKITYEIIDKLD